MQNKDMFTKAVENIGSLNSLIEVMQNYNVSFKKDSSGYFTNCMFHNDNTPSLRLSDKGKKAIYKCFGCEAQGDIINFICNMEKMDNVTALKKAYDILGLELEYKAKENNKIVNFKNYIKTKNLNIRKNNEIYTLEDIYIYSDENKNPLYCKIKYKSDENKKYFITKSLIEIDIGYKFGTTKDFEECKKVLYNLEQIKKAISKNEWIFFVEGEKDVKTLKKLNKPATTIYTRKWQESYSEDLKGAKVAFIGDSGKSGEEFKNFVVEKLKKCCEGLKIIDLPGIEKIGNGRNKDITDWLENGHTEDELLQLLKKSMDILDESFLQQDEYGIYKIKNTIENNIQKKVRYNLTNFQIVDGVIYKNKENNSQKIKLNIISDENEKYTVEYDGRKLFSSVENFREALGINHIFYGNDGDLTAIHKYVLMYFVKEEICEEKNIKLYIYNRDFDNIESLNKEEIKYLSSYLFNFDTKEVVYNFLGLLMINMVKNFTDKKIPVVQFVSEDNKFKNNILKIAKLLFNIDYKEEKKAENILIVNNFEEEKIINFSNIIYYDKNNLDENMIKSQGFLCNTEKGENLLIRFSKNIYNYILENFTEDYFEIEYLICKSKFNFERSNIATYTMMGIKLIYDIFESFEIDMNKLDDLNEVSKIIKNNLEVKTIFNSKSEYEIVLEDIDELIFENENMKIQKDIHYKILSKDYIAFDFESIYKKLNKYYKTYKDNKLLNYHIFINLICRSPYIMNSLKPYRDVKIIYDNENYKIKKMYILKISELKKLEINNIFINVKNRSN